MDMDIEYSDAKYYDNGADLSREEVFELIFEDGSALMDELEVLDQELTLPESIRVLEVNANKFNDATVEFIVRCPDLTVGTRAMRGNDSIDFPGPEYDFYRVGVEAG